jgi:hypothetical protein
MKTKTMRHKSSRMAGRDRGGLEKSLAVAAKLEVIKDVMDRYDEVLSIAGGFAGRPVTPRLTVADQEDLIMARAVLQELWDDVNSRAARIAT